MAFQTLPVKNPWQAVNWSFLIPGVGQIYSEKIIRGILLILFWVCLVIVGLYIIFAPNPNPSRVLILLPVFLIFFIFNLFDAYRCAKRFNRLFAQKELIPPDVLLTEAIKSNKPWMAIFLSMIIPGAGHLYVKRWVRGIIFLIISIAGWMVLKDYHIWLQTLTSCFIIFVIYDAYCVGQSPEVKAKFPIIFFIILMIWRLSPLPAAFFIKNTLVEVFAVPTSSMTPTIQTGDRIIVEKITYRFSAPRVGDIIVFKSPENLEVKFGQRVIAEEDDTVEIRGDGKIYINQKLFLKQFSDILYFSGNYAIKDPYLVQKNTYFTMGDNHNNSRDSRYYGAIPRQNVIGRVYKIYSPSIRAGPVK